MGWEQAELSLLMINAICQARLYVMGLEHLLEDTLLGAVERAGYTCNDTRLVVAVSGGPDSVALLHALVAISDKADLTLYVAHLNHDFRGKEADDDAEFVHDLANSLHLPSEIKKIDPKVYTEQIKLSSFEDAAREMRYDFLSEVVSDVGASSVVLAHTADDLAETILMHIIRGTGVHGLRGMQELSIWQNRTGERGATLFRPFLSLTKSHMLSFCETQNIVYRQDSGNLKRRFTRNKIRHDLLPILKQYNPKVREALLRLSKSSSMEASFIDYEIDRIWPLVTVQEDDFIRIDSHVLSTYHPFIRTMVLRRSYAKLSGDLRRLNQVHLSRMLELVDNPRGRTIHLARGIEVYAHHGEIFLSRGGLKHLCPLPVIEEDFTIDICKTGFLDISIQFSDWQIKISTVENQSILSKDDYRVVVDRKSLGDHVIVRTRRAGDKFHPMGMKTEKKLQDFLVDEKVPRLWRDRVPLLVQTRGIVWVVGYRIAEWAKVTEGCEEAVSIQFERIGTA